MPKERGLERNSLHLAVLSSLFVNLRFNWIVGPRPVNGYHHTDFDVQTCPPA